MHQCQRKPVQTSAIADLMVCRLPASKGWNPLGRWYWNSHWFRCVFLISKYIYYRWSNIVCIYIYTYFFHIFNVCIHRARIQVILLKFWVLCLHMLGKDLNSAIIAAMVKRFSNLLHPTNGCKHTFTWDTSVVVSQCVVCCCKMDLTWVKNASRSVQHQDTWCREKPSESDRENRCNWRTAPPSPPTQK